MTITNHTALFPTVSGKTFGVVMSGGPWAVQCTRCLRICKSASVTAYLRREAKKWDRYAADEALLARAIRREQRKAAWS